MSINDYTGNKMMMITFYSLLFFLTFEYIFSLTIFKSQMIIFFMMIFNLLTFVFCALKYGQKSNKFARLWSVYICLHVLSLGLNGNVSTIPYWIISLLILFMPSQIVRIFKPKIFLYIGLFFAGGVFFQYLFPSLYSIYVSPLFIDVASEFIESSLSNEFGFSGFSPQTGTTAYILLICQSVLLAFKDSESFFYKKLVRYSILFLFVLAIFLTGKRMLSLISLLLLLSSIYAYNTNKNAIRNVVVLFLILGGCYIIFYYFVENVNKFSDNILFKRFASSYTSASYGNDITSGRSALYQKAWYLFEQEPILGIGANNFLKMGGMGTSVHNTYLQVLCEEGILRFPLFIIPLLITFFKTIKAIKRNVYIDSHNILLLSFFIQIVFIFYSFTGNTIVNNNNFVLYFLGISFLIYATRPQFQSY